MLDMGFEPDIRHIVFNCHMKQGAERQTVLFSATFPKPIQILARDFLIDFVHLQVGKVGSTTENIVQLIKQVEYRDKYNELEKDCQACDKDGLTIVFCEKKRTCQEVGDFLWGKGFACVCIHGDKEQWEREKALKEFKSGAMTILVATEVAARGLDVDNVKTVINFELPQDFDSYVHRIGKALCA